MDTLLFSSICLIMATLLSYLGNMTAIFDLISHFRVHYLLAAAVIFPFASVHPDKTPLILIAIATAINAAEILPWYLGSKSQNSKSESVFVTTLNVQFNNHDIKSTVDFLLEKNSDIVLLQELNQRWLDGLKPLKKVYPYEFVEDPKNQFGIGIFSKFKMGKCEVITMGEFGDPAISAEININGKIIKIITVHPVPPLDTPMLKSRNATFHSVADTVKSSPYPVILGGDFNVTMWAPAYKNLICRSGLKNSRKGFGLLGTWPFGKPNHKNFRNGTKKRGTDWIPSFAVHGHPIKLPIDHVLVSPEIMVKNITAGPVVGSDHLPLTAELQIPKA